MSHLNETAADVAALIPRFSWQVMDEEQRDDLMENVVLPRYMLTTSDGTNLGPTWWSETLGATAEAVRSRVKRLRSAESGEGERARAESNSRTDRAAATLRNPDKAAEVLNDPEVRASVLKALDSEPQRTAPTPPAPRRDDSSPLRLIGEFRTLHKTVERLVQLVLEGGAVVSDDERDALLDEVRWLRNALDHVESGLNAGSLDKALVALLEGDR